MPDFSLQRGHKIFIAFAGDDSQSVDFLNFGTQLSFVHSITGTVDADTEATACFLALICGAVTAMLQRADLEYVRVVPAFAQRRV